MAAARQQQQRRSSDRETLDVQVGRLDERIEGLASAIGELKDEFRDFKQFYVTKEEQTAAVAALTRRIEIIESDKARDQERIQFYIRAFVVALLTVLLPEAYALFQFLAGHK